MKKRIPGIILATLVVYLWGFLYWGIASIPYSVWHETEDDAAAGQALLEHFPESGVYFLPGRGNDPVTRAELYETGPTGFVVIDVDGRPEFDAGIMATGFILNGIVLILMALILELCRASTPGYVDRMKLATLVTVIAVVFVNFGDAVWWALPWNWELVQSFYNLAALLIGSAILCLHNPDGPPAA